MPNWTNNKLTVLGDPKRVAAFVAKAHGEHQHYKLSSFDPDDEGPKPSPLSFHQLLPIPDEIMAKEYDPHGFEAEQRLWGCKWGASDDRLVSHGPGRAEYAFDTPWRPARVLFETISAGEWSDLTFIVSWREEYPSRGRFALRGGKMLARVDDSPDKVKPPKGLGDEARSEWWGVWVSHYYDRHEAFVSEIAAQKGIKHGN